MRLPFVLLATWVASAAAGKTTTIFAEVETTTKANRAFWTEKCADIPDETSYLVLTMTTTDDANVVDYFKPIKGTTWCDMLTSNTKHQWSRDASEWVTPPPYDGANANFMLGGSKWEWPLKNVDGNTRTYLTMWGNDGTNTRTGGCCSDTYVFDGCKTTWSQSFTFAFVVLPPADDEKMSDGAIAGIAAGGAVLVLVTIGGVVYARSKRTKSPMYGAVF
jgi:hypothetical protein